jgi:hypothetical protein
MDRARLTQLDILPGLVLHLDPDALEQDGGTYTCGPAERVQGAHFFLCVSATVDGGRWLPLYSKAGVGRVSLSADGRTGHPKWKCGIFHWHPGQVWTAPHHAVLSATTAGGDMSEPLKRNRLRKEYIPVLHADVRNPEADRAASKPGAVPKSGRRVKMTG